MYVAILILFGHRCRSRTASKLTDSSFLKSVKDAFAYVRREPNIEGNPIHHRDHQRVGLPGGDHGAGYRTGDIGAHAFVGGFPRVSRGRRFLHRCTFAVMARFCPPLRAGLRCRQCDVLGRDILFLVDVRVVVRV